MLSPHNNIIMSSFKSNRDILKKEGGPKMVILEYNLKGWAFIGAWAFIRYFTVSNLHNYEY